MNQKLFGYARLARPANLPTAAADILAGVAVAGGFSNRAHGDFLALVPTADILYLVFASIFLYAGGVILNDVFDYKIDTVERPERPIPSGLIPLSSAAIYGGTVLVVGIILAFLVHNLSGYVGAALAVAIVLYDGLAKKHGFFWSLDHGDLPGAQPNFGDVRSRHFGALVDGRHPHRLYFCHHPDQQGRSAR